MGGLGPMAGQNHHSVQYTPEQIPYAIDRYVKETTRPPSFGSKATNTIVEPISFS
jgi:hypothetical protein